jgi:hypothetical protein
VLCGFILEEGFPRDDQVLLVLLTDSELISITNRLAILEINFHKFFALQLSAGLIAKPLQKIR